MVDKIEASVNEIAGGESTIMCAKRSLNLASSFRIESEPKSSAGLGGTGPEVRSFKFGCRAQLWITPSIFGSPESKLVSPPEFGTSVLLHFFENYRPAP